MQVLVVRHAIAEDPADYARRHPDDAGRPLTADGRKKMRKAARGLRALVPELDLLATSPLTRAVQTAEILADEYDGPAPVQTPTLAPAQPLATLADWLDRERRREVVALVGHEPGLSRAVSWLLSGGDRSFVELKKGAACLLEFPDHVGAGLGVLRWSLSPGQLRRLGGEGGGD
ncbi:MAG TPA: histidine phosphatase family protein [Gemmatimonadales bacterium]|nr:histidine phosphatase family protein [Gemmatimonadales bacterium]